MLKYRILFFVLFTWGGLLAQDNSLLDFNSVRLQQQKTSMLVLGGWAVTNIAVGASLFGQYRDERRYFHQMNAGWNLVNLGIATFGYLSSAKIDPTSLDAAASILQHQGLQKTLLFNAGLDIGYMMGGLYMMERSKSVEKNAERLKGFGQSIVLQGGFLFVFDVVTYFIQAKHNSALEELIGGLYFTGQQIGISLQF